MTHEQILEQSRKDLKAIYKQAKEKLKGLEVTPHSNLEIGKWYKYKDSNGEYTNSIIANFQGKEEDSNYGFDFLGKWRNDVTLYNHKLGREIIEATPQEVEKALIEEAKRIGHAYSEYDYNPEENELCGINDGRLESIFADGHWEQPTDKFAELKEAFKNGAVIQSKVVFVDEPSIWEDVPNPIWNPKIEYRIKPEEGPQYFNLTQLTGIVKEQTKAMTAINERLKKVEASRQVAEKPEEKPKVGDVCKFWDDDENTFIIGKLKEIHASCLSDEFSYPYVTGNYSEYKNAKTLTPQQVQELLFGKDPS